MRHSNQTFTLILESGAHVRGVVTGDGVGLPTLGELWSQEVVVTGVAEFRPSGSVLQIEAERIERASARDLSLWSADPRPIFDILDERALRQPQGPRSGVNAIFSQLADAALVGPSEVLRRHAPGDVGAPIAASTIDILVAAL